MIYLVMLLFIPTIISSIYAHYCADKRFLVGKESDEMVEEMEKNNHRIYEFMNKVHIHSNLKDYTISVTVEDGKITRVVTETKLTEQRMMIGSDNNYTSNTDHKGISPICAKIIAFVTVFFLTEIFSVLITLLMEEYHIIQNII